MMGVLLADNTMCIGALKDGTFKYADSSGYNLDTQALVFKVNLPKSGNC